MITSRAGLQAGHGTREYRFMSTSRNSTLLLLLAIAAVMLPDSAARAQSDPSRWPAITAQSRPWTRWWWQGSAVDAANLDRELARYQAAGLGGVEITPIYGVHGWESREIPYLTPAWMQVLVHAIDTGKQLGLETDMSTGTGWCFGGPTTTAADANAALVATTQTVPPGGSLTGVFDPGTTQALVAFSADGRCLELTGRLRPDGRVDWSAEGGPWTVYAISQKPSGVMVKRAAPGGAGPMLNLFYPAAMGRYLQWFEEPFAAARPKLRALFHDSYEYNSDWAPDFFAQFEKLRGYRLQTELPALLGTGQDDHVARVKSDYRETLSEIMALQSIPAWVNWSHARGLLTRYQAHGSPGNLLDLYADADIPETEMFHADRNILVSKFASSAAHVSGKNLASAETGTWLAEHFTETLGEMKSLADEMFLAGINHLVYHGTAYSPDEAAWPGWCFYASTEMNPRNSIWHDVPALNAYVARCQAVLQSGRADADVLVYWPIYDSWDDARGMVAGFSVSGQGWFNGQPIDRTARQLWDRGFAFDYVSDRQLTGIQVADGRLLLGGSSYRAVVVPPCRRLPSGTLKQLLALAAGGATVIFDEQMPADVPGWGNLAARREEFRALLGGIRHGDQDAPDGMVLGRGRVAVAPVARALELAGVRREPLADQAGLRFVRRAVAGGRYYFIANRGGRALDGWINLATAARAVELMDPMTGEIGLARSKPTSEGVAVRLALEPGESMILRTSDAAATVPAWAYRQADGEPIELSGDWQGRFIEGGPALPASFHTTQLVSWTGLGGPAAQSFAGTALYSLTFPAPGGRAGPWSLRLGTICQSARVRLNGKPLGTVFAPPFRVPVATLLPAGNLLEVEVTNVSANRVRDLDVRHVPWKIFYPPNVLSVDYKPFDAAGWPLAASGLLGPVTLTPEKADD